MNPWYISTFELILRLILALVLGGVIGLEREKRNRAAGFRTNILVCVGSALIMLLSIHGFSQFSYEYNVRLDPARLAAQVVSGIGFLGAGVIMFNGFSITGLTTAASLWVVAGIGLSVGAGFYMPAVIVTIIVLFSLLILNKIEMKWLQPRHTATIYIQALNNHEVLHSINTIMEQMRLLPERMHVEKKDGKAHQHDLMKIKLELNASHKIHYGKLMEKLHQIEAVRSVETD